MGMPKVDIYYEPMTLLYHADVSKGDVQSRVSSETEDGLAIAVGEAIELIETGRITPQEPVFYNAVEADIDRQLAAMRPKSQSIYSGSSYSSPSSSIGDVAPFIAMGFLAGIC